MHDADEPSLHGDSSVPTLEFLINIETSRVDQGKRAARRMNSFRSRRDEKNRRFVL